MDFFIGSISFYNESYIMSFITASIHYITLIEVYEYSNYEINQNSRR